MSMMLSMSRKRNLVAHYCDTSSNSDKVYMACVRQDGNKWLVIGKWGRRGRNLSAQIKLTTQEENIAFREQTSLFLAKMKEGYIDIDSSLYKGGLTLQSPGIKENLEPEVVDSNDTKIIHNTDVLKDASEKIEKNRKAQENNLPKDLVAVCLKNEGIEDKFDLGVEYVFENHKDKSMIWVFDKFGMKGEFFHERFEIKKGQ